MEIEEEIRITDLETLKIISDPLRVQILERIGLASDAGQLLTVKQLADDLDIPATKLYYHVNLLEKHDLICIAGTQVVSGIIEKHYQVRAKRFRADLSISKDTTLNRDQGVKLTLSSVANMFSQARNNLEQSLRRRQQESDSDVSSATMLSTQAMMQLSREQAKEFIDEINNLVEKFSALNNRMGLTFGLTLLFNPNYHIHPTQSEAQIPELDTLKNPILGIDEGEIPLPPQI